MTIVPSVRSFVLKYHKISATVIVLSYTLKATRFYEKKHDF